MSTFNRIAKMALCGLMLSTYPASAQTVTPNDCTCVTELLAASGKALGNITGLNGDVLYSAASGYEIATIGTLLTSGSQIAVGKNAWANISVGSSCNLRISENSEATISQLSDRGGEICVRVSEPQIDAALDTVASTQAPPNILPLIIVGGVVVGGTVTYAVVTGGDDSASN